MQQDYPKDDMEVLFVDGMSTDRTREIIGSYLFQCPYLRVLDNPEKIVPYAMNIGINSSQGEIIMRLDAHASYPANYFSVLSNQLITLGADNVGAVCKTDVLNKTPKTLAIREVLGNKFGIGNSTFRTGINHVQEVDTVPFGCWKRCVFEKYGLYDIRLVRNQDIELNKRILRGGGKILIVPDTYSTYFARETFQGVAKNNFGNGKWNILTVFYTKQFSSLSIRHFIPLAFLLSLILPLITSLLYSPLALLSVLSAVCYTSLLSIISANLSITKHLNWFYLISSFLTLHLSYGYGSLMGLIKLPFIKR